MRLKMTIGSICAATRKLFGKRVKKELDVNKFKKAASLKYLKDLAPNVLVVNPDFNAKPLEGFINPHNVWVGSYQDLPKQPTQSKLKLKISSDENSYQIKVGYMPISGDSYKKPIPACVVCKTEMCLHSCEKCTRSICGDCAQVRIGRGPDGPEAVYSCIECPGPTLEVALATPAKGKVACACGVVKTSALSWQSLAVEDVVQIHWPLALGGCWPQFGAHRPVRKTPNTLTVKCACGRVGLGGLSETHTTPAGEHRAFSCSVFGAYGP